MSGPASDPVQPAPSGPGGRKGGGTSWRRSLLLIVCCLAALAASPAAAFDGQRLEEQYRELQSRFEEEAARLKDRRAVGVLSLKALARTWALAARSITRPEAAPPWDAVEDWAAALAEFEKVRNSETGALRALRLYRQAAAELIRAYLLQTGQNPEDLDALMAGTENRLAGLSAAGLEEERKILSGSLVGLFSILLRALPDHALLDEPCAAILRDLRARAETLERAPDVHALARENLLYLNNVDGLTRLLFLLGHSAGSQIWSRLEPVQNAWSRREDGRAQSVVLSVSLSWAAQAQASPLLAYWLAGMIEIRPPHPGDSP